MPGDAPVHVRDLTFLGGFEIRLGFTDGSESTVDLGPCLRGPGVEGRALDLTLFAGIKVDPALGTIVWPNGEDVAPEILYEPTSLAEGPSR